MNTPASAIRAAKRWHAALADLENGAAGPAFASGSAAMAAVLDCLDGSAHLIADLDQALAAVG